MLVKYVEKKKNEWEKFLDTCVFAYNTSKHDSSEFSPFELMFFRKAVLPIDINTEANDVETILKDFNEAQEISDDGMKRSQTAHGKLLEAAKANIVKAQGKQKEHYDKKHCIKGTDIYVAS